MSLDSHEKHALRQKEKLAFGSQQFPILGGPKLSRKAKATSFRGRV